MGGDWRNELNGWLAAEREGREAEADARFAAVFAARVPRLRPSAAFADRVMRRLAARAAGRPRVFAPAARAVLAVALVSAGTAAALFWSAGIYSLVGGLRDVLPALAAVLGAAGSWLGAARQASAVVVSVARAMSVAVASGPVAVIILVNLALACSASCGLKRLLAPQEE